MTKQTTKRKWMLGAVLFFVILTAATVLPFLLLRWLPTYIYASLDSNIPDGASLWIPGVDELKTDLYLNAYDASQKMAGDANGQIAALEQLSNAVKTHFYLSKYSAKVQPRSKYALIEKRLQMFADSHGKGLSPSLVEHLEERSEFAFGQDLPEADEFFETALQRMKSLYGPLSPRLTDLVESAEMHYQTRDGKDKLVKQLHELDLGIKEKQIGTQTIESCDKDGK